MSGYGERDSANKVYLTLKVKKGTEIDPHIEVRKIVGTKYEKVSDKTVWVEGKFAGIDYGTYEVEVGKDKPKKIKNKIMVNLVSGTELFVVQSAMNCHARNIMNNMLGLFEKSEDAGKVGTIKISVGAKNGFANTYIEHNGELIGWSMDYDTQKTFHGDAGDGYTDHSALEEHFLKRWKKLKLYLEEKFPAYKERADAIAGDQTKAEDQAAGAPAETAPHTEEPTHIGPTNPADEEQDLPF